MRAFYALRGGVRRALLGAYDRDIDHLFARHGIGASDHIVVHTNSAPLCLSLMKTMGRLPSGARPALHVRFVHTDSVLEDRFGIYRKLSDFCDEARVYLYAELVSVAVVLAPIFPSRQIDILRLPVSPLHPVPDRAKRLKATHRLNVLLYGTIADTKGWRRARPIQQAARAQAAGSRLPELAFAAQVGADPQKLKPRHKAWMESVEAAGMTLTVGRLQEEALSALIEAHDLVLLPYDLGKLDEPGTVPRGSGVAEDCLAHGVPMVVPAGSAFEEYVAGGNGLAARTDEEFAAAILEIARNYPRFAAAAEVRGGRRAPVAGDEPYAGPDRQVTSRHPGDRQRPIAISAVVIAGGPASTRNGRNRRGRRDRSSASMAR